MKRRIISLVLVAAMAMTLGLQVMSIPYPTTEEPEVPAVSTPVDVAGLPAFAITGVEIVNNRVAIIRFNEQLSEEFEQFSLARPNYLTYFVRVNGAWLQEDKNMAVTSGARMYLRDDRMSVELVLGPPTPGGTNPAGAPTTFPDGEVTIEFDFRNRDFIPFYYFFDENQQEQSGDAWVRDIHNRKLGGGVANCPTLRGTAPATVRSEAPFLAIEEARIIDSRTLYVRFNQRITMTPSDAGQSMTGFPNLLNRGFVSNAAGHNSQINPNAFNILGGDEPLRAAHSFLIPNDINHPVLSAGAAARGGNNGQEFLITYNDDFLAGVNYYFSLAGTANWGNNQHLRGLINASGLDYTPQVGAGVTIVNPPVVPPADFNILTAELHGLPTGPQLVRGGNSGQMEMVFTFDRALAFTQVTEASRYRTRNAPNQLPWAAKFHDVIDPAQSDNWLTHPDGLPGVLANRSAYFQSLHETGTGMTGTVLTAGDLALIFNFDGVNAVTPGGTVPLLDAFRSDSILGYFRNAHTIVIHNQNRFPIVLAANPTVTVQPGTIVGYGNRNIWSARVNNPDAVNNAEAFPDEVGVLVSRTNGFRNTQIGPRAITNLNQVMAWHDMFDPAWSADLVTIEPTQATQNHNDIYYFQFDGIKDPLIAGFSGSYRVSPNIGAGGARVFTPGGHQFGAGNDGLGVGNAGGSGTLELAYLVKAYHDAYVIENRWISAVVVPGSTARLLSVDFKPTGHDIFYTNPSATNYNITGHDTAYPPLNLGGGTFVLSWLLVWGGTFPVFEGCEHGHVWTTPWEYEIIHYPDGAIGIRHFLTNDQNLQANAGNFVPSSNNIGIGGDFVAFGTDLEYTVEYIVRPDSPVVDMAVTVHNPSQVARTYEYYTCNTLAPGERSRWGHGSMKHIDNNQICLVQGWPAPPVVHNLHQGEASNDRSFRQIMPYGSHNWGNTVDIATYIPQWIRDRMYAGQGSRYGQTTGSIDRTRFYDFYVSRYLPGNNNLTTFATDLNRRPQADWYGVVNMRNLEGVMRAGPDLQKHTPAIKYWIWGYREMFDNIPMERNSGAQGRPYMEPWAGTGDQYFSNRAIAAGETHHWVESYYHTFGLEMATNATEHGMAYIKFDATTPGMVRPMVQIYDTRLLRNMTVQLLVGGTRVGSAAVGDMRIEGGTVVATHTYVSQIIAHEEFTFPADIPADQYVEVRVFEGPATGTPILTAWARADRPFVTRGATMAWSDYVTDSLGRTVYRPDMWTDRETPVDRVIISHAAAVNPQTGISYNRQGVSIDIPGRVPATGNVPFRLRELFAYAEPFSADGKGVIVWSKQSGDVDELTITSGVNNPGHVANTTTTPGTSGGWGTTNNTGSTWWHTFDFITLRGHEPGSQIVLRATAADENVYPRGSVYAEITVNVRKPLYMSIPYNAGNFTAADAYGRPAVGTTPGTVLGRRNYSPYMFNLPMWVPLTISAHALDVVEGPIRVEFWHRNHLEPTYYIAFDNLELGVNYLHIPANTFPREDYYRLVARNANGDAFGYEFFRVDGFSDVDWERTVLVEGDDVVIRFEKRNSRVVGDAVPPVSLTTGATAFVNDVEFPVVVGDNNTQAGANRNTLIIVGGAAALQGVGISNFIEVLGVRIPEYMNYESFSIANSFIR